MVAKLRTVGSTTNRRDGPVGRVLARVRRPLDRRYLTAAGRLEDFQALGEDAAQRAAGRDGGPRVLVVSLRAWVVHNGYEAVFAHALRLRGATTALLTCGGGLPICEVGWGRRVAPRACDRCAHFTDRFAGAAQIEHYRLADELSWAPNPSASARGRSGRRTSASRRWGWWTTASPGSRAALSPRRTQTGDRRATSGSPSKAVAEAAGGASSIASRRTSCSAFNGLFAEQRVVGKVAGGRGIRVCSYEIGVRGGTLLYNQNGPAALFDTDELWRQTGDRPLTPEQDAMLQRLLDDCAAGVGAHETYFDSVEQSDDLRARLGVAPRSA